MGSRLFILAAEHDVLCTPELLHDAAERYRKGFGEVVRRGKIEGVGEQDLGGADEDWNGVRFRGVKGVAHHLQNHVEWERGADEVLEWVEGM